MKTQQANQTTPYVEIKQVTWTKDSHGLFDYESKNVNYTRTKVDSAAKMFKDGNGIMIRNPTKPQSLTEIQANGDINNYLFSIVTQGEKNDTFYIKSDKAPSTDDDDKVFLIVRSLKNDDGNQRGYSLDLGDIIRLGRIEYRVLEFQDHNQQKTTLLGESSDTTVCPFNIAVKDCNGATDAKKQCRICLMDENDVPEILVNPCNCKGTSEYVHVQCLQDWISSKLKKKVNAEASCFYYKKLVCEVCKVSLPDLVDVDGERKELAPINRPDGPYILLERVFYDKTKENKESAADNSKMMILLSLSAESQQIKLGRGHECDLRENDISVSRLHAFIKYQDGVFTLFDNNSKFGTLVLLRRSLLIEKKKKLALQLGRTVVTFSMKQATVNNVPVFRNPMFMEKLSKFNTPKAQANGVQIRAELSSLTKHKTVIGSNSNRPNFNVDGNLFD